MHANKKCLLLLFFVVIISIPFIYVRAYNVSVGARAYAGDSFVPYKYLVIGTKKQLSFCSQYSKGVPSSCNTPVTFDEDVMAGLGELISWYKANPIGKRYVCTEKLITKFLYNYYDKQGRTNFELDSSYTRHWTNSCGAKSIKNAYKAAEDAFNAVNNVSTVEVKYNKKTLNFSKNKSGAYVASVATDIKKPYSLNCELSGVEGSVKTDQNGNIAITISASKITQETTVELKCRARYKYSGPTQFYSNCGTGKQQLINIKDLSEDLYEDGSWASISGKITPKPVTPQKGGIIIEKRKSDGGLLFDIDKSIKFRLYKNSNCSGSYYKTAIVPGELVSGLTPGTYYLQEYSTKSGYHKPQTGEQWYCEPITVDVGVSEKVITVTNYTECEYRFDENMSMKERIDLYNDLASNGQDFNALLDMNNTTDETACKNIARPTGYTRNCLITDSNSFINRSSFTEKNLSLYTERYGDYTFCYVYAKGDNRLLRANFGPIGSGRAIISGNRSISRINVDRVCYDFGDNSSQVQPDPLTSYVGSAKLTNMPDYNVPGVPTFGDLKTEGNRTQQKFTVEFYTPYVAVSKKDGILLSSCTDKSCIETYGIYTKLNEPAGKYEFNLNISLNEDKFGELESTQNCTYTIENDFVYKNSKLALEFRTVNTDSNVFVDKDGNEREPGANWGNDGIINMIGYTLIGRNNSYNKFGLEPMFKITLTPSKIKKIREYNKNNPYDEKNITCYGNGSYCGSSFLDVLSGVRSNSSLNLSNGEIWDMSVNYDLASKRNTYLQCLHGSSMCPYK